MELEYKNLEIEIKAIDETGTFTGIASPYNNVDTGNDRVLNTAGKRNNNKTVPMLWQHDTHCPIGSLLLTDTKEGIQANGKLILDKGVDYQYMVPQASTAYALLKSGLLKLSIGYKTLLFEFVTEGKQTIRNLKDIEIMEVSLVTFPMNDKAKIISVKEDGGNKVELEEKAMGFADLLKVQQANDMRWKLQDALSDSFRQLMNDESMKPEDKIAQMNTNVDDFATAYKGAMGTLLNASASKVAKKEINSIIEKKEAESLETKAGKKISAANKEKIKKIQDMNQQVKDMMDDLMGCVEDDPADDETGDKAKKEKSSSIEIENKQESNKDDTLELKADELEILTAISKNLKGDEK